MICNPKDKDNVELCSPDRENLKLWSKDKDQPKLWKLYPGDGENVEYGSKNEDDLQFSGKRLYEMDSMDENKPERGPWNKEDIELASRDINYL